MIERTSSGQLRYNGNPVLVRYIRDNLNRRVGVVVATVVDGKVRFSFSKTNVAKGDKFDRERGLEMALGRLVRGKDLQYPFEDFVTNGVARPLNGKIRTNLLSLFYRARNYFRYVPDNGLNFPTPFVTTCE